LHFVSKDTGLPIKHPVKRQLADREQVRRFIEHRIEDDPDAKRLGREEIVLKKFGLLPRNFNLRSFLVDLLQEQVAGFYDAKSKTVYLLDWVDPEQQKPVLAHELTHALQDQNFKLEKMSEAARRNDPTGLQADERISAQQAVTEGQAMIVLMDYTLSKMGTSVQQQPALVDLMQSEMSSADPSMVVFNRAPLFLQQVLLFPYRYGTLFERDLLVKGGKERAFAGVLRNPPQETRQIMQPATYLDGSDVPPLRPVSFDKIIGSGYKKWDLSPMGEFDVYLLLTRYAGAETADVLGRQWRGGYYWAGVTPSAARSDEEAHTTGDIASAYVSRWASADAATQFAAAYSGGVPRRYPGAQKVSAAGQLAWETSDGLITIEPQGDTVLVMESFDPESAKKIQGEVFGK
jgi:hypothetical protein